MKHFLWLSAIFALLISQAHAQVQTGGAGNGMGTGSVTSVALAAPNYFSVSGSPITTSGTLTLTGASLSQNLVLASPNGSSGALGARALVNADLPALAANQVLGAVTATTPSGQTVPGCSATGSAISYTSGTGFGCNSGLMASWIPGFGLTNAVGTQNTGSQTITSGGTASPQLFPVSYSSNHTLAAVDAGQLDVVSGAGVTFTMLNPGSGEGNTFQFLDTSGNSYTLATASGTASIQGNFTGGNATTQLLPANSVATCIDFSTTYQCAIIYGDYARKQATIALIDAGTVAVNASSSAGLTAAYTLTLTGNGHQIANPTNAVVGQQIDFLINSGSGPFYLGTLNGAANGWGAGYTWATGSPAIIGQIASTVTEVKCTVTAATPTLLCYGPINSSINNTTAATPTAPASTSAFAMQGLAGSITPTTTGNIAFEFDATINTTSTAVGNGISYQCSWGTGTPPVNAAALTGTQVGGIRTWEIYATATAVNVFELAYCSGIITNATAGVPIWLDVAAESKTTVSTTKFVNANITAWEVR